MPEACLRRVSVHCDDAHVDLTLPAGIAVAALLPSIADIVATRGGHRDDLVVANYQLSRPGEAALDASKTLAQHRIRDGSLLLLNAMSAELPAPSYDEPTEAVTTALAEFARPWTRRAARLTSALAALWLGAAGALTVTRTVLAANDARQSGLAAGVVATAGCGALLAAVLADRGFRDDFAGLMFGLQATGFMTVAGLVVVPGSAGAPNVLLAATATAVTAVVVLHVTDCGTATFRAIASFAGVAALAALVATVAGLSVLTVGSMSVVISLVLLELSARVSVLLAGLSPRMNVDDKISQVRDTLSINAIEAESWLTSLTAASATSAALGGIAVALTAYRTGGPGGIGIAFAALTGAVLLGRTRSQNGAIRRVILHAAGTGLLGAVFASAAAGYATHVVWIVAAATLLPAAPLCGYVLAAAVRLSPVAQRGGELIECLALAVLVPLACWICGFFEAARGLHLP